MRVAFTTAGTTLDAPLEPQFGRASGFLLHDTESGTSQVLANHRNLIATQGAGIQAATAIVRSGAEVLVTGHCGPRAFDVLSRAGIRVFLTDAPTVGEALARLRSGALTPAATHDVAGHSS